MNFRFFLSEKYSLISPYRASEIPNILSENVSINRLWISDYIQAFVNNREIALRRFTGNVNASDFTIRYEIRSYFETSNRNTYFRFAPIIKGTISQSGDDTLINISVTPPFSMLVLFVQSFLIPGIFIAIIAREQFHFKFMAILIVGLLINLLITMVNYIKRMKASKKQLKLIFKAEETKHPYS